MDGFLRQSTATVVKIGPFSDSADGNTDKTTLVLTQPDIRLSKGPSGAFAQKADTGAATHDSIGYYDCPLAIADADTVGRLVLAVHEAGALPVRHVYIVLPANVYDALAGTDLLNINVAQLSEDDIAADNLEAAYDGTGYVGTNNVLGTVLELASGAITPESITPGSIDASALASDAVAEILAAISGIVPTAAQNRDAVWAKAMTELAAVPGVTGTVLQALELVFLKTRNRLTQTATTSTLFASDGVTPLFTATVSSDGTTFIRGALTAA